MFFFDPIALAIGLHIIERIAIGIASGVAFVALFLFLFKEYPKTEEGRSIVQTIFKILKFFQWTLFFLFVFFLVSEIGDSIEYFLKMTTTAGIIISGHLMTQKMLSPKWGVIFTAGGWYFLSIFSILVALSFYQSTLYNGALLYLFILSVFFVLIHAILFFKKRT